MLILLFCSLVSATNSRIPPQIGGTLQVQEIQVPFYLYNNTNDIINVHVFNSTGFAVTNATTSCTIHIYNSSGDHLIEDRMLMDANGIDYYYPLPSNVTQPFLGDRAYIVQCNNTKEAGFASGTFTIANGSGLDDPTNYIGIAVILVILMLGMFALGLGLKDEHYVLKMFFIWVGTFLFVLISQVAVQMAQANYLDPSIISLLTNLNYVTILGGIVVSAYFMIYIISQYLTHLAGAQKKNNLRTR
jgi:hypothetical protein